MKFNGRSDIEIINEEYPKIGRIDTISRRGIYLVFQFNVGILWFCHVFRRVNLHHNGKVEYISRYVIIKTREIKIKHAPTPLDVKVASTSIEFCLLIIP